MSFDYAGAKAAGYSDNEIQSYLQKKNDSQGPTADTSNNYDGGGIVGLLHSLIPGNTIAHDVGAAMGISQPTNDGRDYQREAIEKARTVTDPEQKARLLKVAQQGSQVGSQIAQDQQAMFSPDNELPVANRVGQTMGETAATFLPELKIAKGAGIGSKLANKATTGSVRGGLYGASQSEATPGSTAASAGAGAFLEPLISALGSGKLSKGGVWKSMEGKAQAGSDISWDQITKDALSEAENKPASVQRALKNLIAEETPSSGPMAPNSTGPAFNSVGNEPTTSVGDVMSGGKLTRDMRFKQGNPSFKSASTVEPKEGFDGPMFESTPYSPQGTGDVTDVSLTASKGLELRGSLGERLPQNFFQKLTNQVPKAEQDAINILRRTVSTHLKKSAPGIAEDDALYSFYSKMHGDVPTWAKRAIGGLIADKLVGNKLGGAPREVVDALTAILAGGV
jgi:hypothetical protein